MVKIYVLYFLSNKNAIIININPIRPIPLPLLSSDGSISGLGVLLGCCLLRVLCCVLVGGGGGGNGIADDDCNDLDV
jgi:hypothetical protein